MSQKTSYERLWAPWRLPWIKESSGVEVECFICDYLQQEPANDRENLVLHRGEHALILMNRYPYANGHLMVAPNRHLDDPRQLSAEQWLEIGRLTQVSMEALQRAVKAQGFNIGWNIGRIAGAGLHQHIHQHVVPRWNGDTNFMPVVGETKVLSQDLWDAYDAVSDRLEELRAEGEV